MVWFKCTELFNFFYTFSNWNRAWCRLLRYASLQKVPLNTEVFIWVYVFDSSVIIIRASWLFKWTCIVHWLKFPNQRIKCPIEISIDKLQSALAQFKFNFGQMLQSVLKNNSIISRPTADSHLCAYMQWLTAWMQLICNIKIQCFASNVGGNRLSYKYFAMNYMYTTKNQIKCNATKLWCGSNSI